jgi:hypothetical protein
MKEKGLQGQAKYLDQRARQAADKTGWRRLYLSDNQRRTDEGQRTRSGTAPIGRDRRAAGKGKQVEIGKGRGWCTVH